MGFLPRLAFVTVFFAALVAVPACMNPRPHRVRVGNGTCATCHMNDYLDAGVPRDAALPEGGVACTMSHTSPYWFPTDCAFCHVESAWCDVPVQRVVGNHEPTFPLDGPHQPTSLTTPSTLEQCVSCHLAPPADPTRPDWLNRPRDCASCHADDRARADAKFCNTHSSFPNDCSSCHRASGWSPAIPGPHRVVNTSFHITGGAKHAGIACQDCHDLDRYPTDAGLLPTCLADGGILPAFVPSYTPYPGCTQNDYCPDCNCVSCHSPSRYRGDHEDERAAYDSCTNSMRPSHCLNCHYR